MSLGMLLVGKAIYLSANYVFVNPLSQDSLPHFLVASYHQDLAQ